MSAAAQPLVRRTAAGQSLRLSAELQDIGRHLNLLYELVHRDLTIRYKRSVFGFLWTMLHPLLLMLIFMVVFANLFRRSTPHYETYFLSAYIVWTFFAQTTTYAMARMAWNGPLMKRVRVPRTIFPLAATLSGLVNLLLSLLALLGIMLIARAPMHPAIVAVPPALLIVAVFTLGATLILSAVSVYFADVREMYQAALPALLYLSPVIYPISVVPEKFRWVIEWNPLTFLLEIVRQPVYQGTIPSARTYGLSLLAAVVSAVTGWLIYRRVAPHFDNRF